MDSREELGIKIGRLRALLTRRRLDAAVLRSRANFAWITAGGRGFVNQAQASGVAAIVVTPGGVQLVSNNIEAARLAEEEIGDLPIDVAAHDWWDADGAAAMVRKVSGGEAIGVDMGPGGIDISADIDAARAELTDAEVERYREDGPVAAATVEAIARQIRPGVTEQSIAAMVQYAFNEQGFRVAVCLVGADERIDTRRHPVMTDRKVRQRALVVAVAERQGLFTAVSRLVCLGKLDDQIAARHRAVCEVNATAIDATRVGRPMNAVLADIVAEYERQGFGDEWRYHHQGGPTGYTPRDLIVNPSIDTPVAPRQAFAWNPTITGTKCEDTFVVGDDEPVMLCGPGAAWPAIVVDRPCGAIRCADILVVD
ncbi:MAG: M24 family metallopeptidase [Phycisphaera sp.]|nr:M24 family metallopeptidase [Phycisphaera sp.]